MPILSQFGAPSEIVEIWERAYGAAQPAAGE